MKLRKNEMKLRKNEIISPKNLFVPRRGIKNFYGGIFDCLRRDLDKLTFIMRQPCCTAIRGELDTQKKGTTP